MELFILILLQACGFSGQIFGGLTYLTDLWITKKEGFCNSGRVYMRLGGKQLNDWLIVLSGECETEGT